MVQVDVFWSYGFGTGFALAAAEQLGRAPARERSFLADEHFARNLLFLALRSTRASPSPIVARRRVAFAAGAGSRRRSSASRWARRSSRAR